jgi:hypothetical protein
MRPMLPNCTDRTPKYEKAYKVLIERAREAGAGAISYETAFYPSAIPKEQKWKWDMIDAILGIRMRKMYLSFGRLQSCTRPSYLWTENIMHAVAEEAHKVGMTVGVSDPVWKQLSEVGCCCGIRPDDPVFGNWQRKNATNALVCARDGKNDGVITLDDIVPEWAYEMPLAGMIKPGPGAENSWLSTHGKWEFHLRKVWNDPNSQRSPMNYFQGALEIVGEDEKYKGLVRENRESAWSV